MKKAIAVILLIGIFGFGCVFIPFITIQEYRTYKDYTENGYTVQCTATAVKGTNKTREVTADYTDKDGNPHTYTLRRAYAMINAGDSFTAYVLPDKPDQFWIKYELGDIAMRLAVYGLLFIIGLAVPIYALMSRKEAKILKERGRPVTGTIMRSYVNGNGFKYGVIGFSTERGSEVTGEVQLKKYQHDGDSIDLVYAYDDKGKLWWRLV